MLSVEEKREKNRLKMQKFRATHREYLRAYDRARNPKRTIQNRLKIYEGRNCGLCGIPMATPFYGALGTKKHCLTCSKDLRTIGRIRMRNWRKRKLDEQRRAKKIAMGSRPDLHKLRDVQEIAKV